MQKKYWSSRPLLNASDLVNGLFGWCGDIIDPVGLLMTLDEYPLRVEVLMTLVVHGDSLAGETTTWTESSPSDS